MKKTRILYSGKDTLFNFQFVVSEENINCFGAHVWPRCKRATLLSLFITTELLPQLM